MATEDDKDLPEDDKDLLEDDEKEKEEGGKKKEKEEEEEETKEQKEIREARERRDRATKRARELAAEVKSLKEKLAGDKKPDPIAAANTRLVTAETRGALAAIGVTDKSDQRTVLDFLNLSDVTVSEDGEVDTDRLNDMVTDLQRIFGGKPGQPRRNPRTDTRDRGGEKAKTVDDATKRRIGMLGP